LSPSEVDAVIQDVRLELWRDNFAGALEILETANRRHPDPLLAAEAGEIRSWLNHLRTREAYVTAYERYYRTVRQPTGFKRLDRELRTFLGRRTRKMVERTARHPEFLLLEREVLALRPARALDAGCGEGRIALTIGARHPQTRVDGIEISTTNVDIARKLNRFPNVTFHHGLLEEVERWCPPGSVDLAYAFAVLEHVRDVDGVVNGILQSLRPGGRFCFVVPMNEFIITGPIPPFHPHDGVAGHVRAFTEAGLRGRFGGYKDFVLEKVPAERWRVGTYPPCFAPREFGSFFVAFSKS
jgi:SAM-dependent methyltransferase